jgi:hypothetical protein
MVDVIVLYTACCRYLQSPRGWDSCSTHFDPESEGSEGSVSLINVARFSTAKTPRAYIGTNKKCSKLQVLQCRLKEV